MAEVTTSRYESNYIKIAMVVLQVSPRAIRVQFDKEFHPNCLHRTLKSKCGCLSDLKTKRRITQPQWNLLFPRTGEPSSKDFDVTLMICLLRNLIPIDIMDRLPSATDISLRADLSRIKFYRNLIVNCDAGLVTDTDFESYWKDVIPAILRLGGHSFKVECDDWYERNLDVEQRDEGLKYIKIEKRLALIEEELAEQSKMLAEQSKELAEQSKDEIKVNKELLSKGTFMSYDNCVYLAGACNVGKSTLASILIGEEISQDWKSTDGLTIYFGRNGIDLKNKEMVPLNQDFDDVLSKVLRGKPELKQEKPDTQRTDITAPTPSLVPGTGKDDVNITDPVGQQSPQDYIITTIQKDIKEEIRKGTYKIEIAPSDLVDFGGQRSFDMTHQLFMRRKGTFVLMFNGRIDFSVPLEEYKQGETTESILKHWVNSILSYCGDDDDILPIIMFCATHSDYFNQEDYKDRKEKLIHDLGEIFKNHKRHHRIIYDDIFFINGQDKIDLEINKLKSKLVEVACKQKSWGKQMPMACVPLNLQMSELRLHNMSIISKEELITLNKRNEDLALTDEQIKIFLNDQHSLGKIVYFDQHGLDNFINLQPQSLVNILRSFITAECFWPEDKELKGILRALTDTGKIAKEDLLKLWSQKKFHQHMPNDDFKEFIIQVLVHLDILVEPRHYIQEKESKVQSYLVPCIVKRRLPVTDFYVKSADKMICLSYTLLKSSIPAALSFKLIGAAMNLWPLKKEGICLYHQAAILCIDKSNDLHLLVKDDRVFVYLINKVAKRCIPPSIASTVQECLTFTMTKVLEFYHKSFGKSLSTLDVSKAFEIKVGEWCTSDGGCYISVPELEKETEWRCKNNKLKRHDKTYPRYWICNKKQVKCDEKCPGTTEELEALSNLKIKTENQQDDQAGAMASSSQESSSNNISTGNDQSSQGYQSSIETDAEPYNTSVNNDLENKRDDQAGAMASCSQKSSSNNISTGNDQSGLENKRDIYDGVVLHAEDDRDAAIEFIRNMEMENPELNINITIYECLFPGKPIFQSAAEIFDICRCLFVFATQNFVETDLETLLASIATMKIITSKEEIDRLITVKASRNCNHHLLDQFLPLKYYYYLEAKKTQQCPDEFFIKSFKQVITDRRQKYLK